MKLTRRQLRRLIKESLISEMPMIKPGLDLDDETYGKFEKMAMTDDPMTQTQVDFLASDFGYPEEKSFSSDLKTYYDLDLLPALRFSQEEIDKLIGDLFAVNPGMYQGAVSQGGMTLQDIAAELFESHITYYAYQKNRASERHEDESFETFDKFIKKENDLLMDGMYDEVHPFVLRVVRKIEEALKKHEYDRSTGVKNWS